MSEDEWVDAFEGASVADLSWYRGQAENGSVSQQDSWLPRNLADMEDEPPVKPELGGLGLVYPGKRHVFSGPQESAKTLAAYVIGISVVRLEHKIVLIDFEMGPWDAKTRLRELGCSDEEMASILYVAPDTPASEVAVGALVETGAALAIVDAAAGAFDLEGYDDNSRKDVEKWAGKWVTPFWRAGVATIVLDHVTKNAETRGNYAIGSERKVGGADVHLGFEVVTPIKRGGHGLYKVVTHKDRGGFLKRGKLAEFELQSDPDTNVITWAFKAPIETPEGAVWRPTVKMEQVSRWLERHSESVPMSHVEEGVGGNRDACRDAIQILIDEAHVAETAGPRKARMLEIVTVYREANDLSSTSPDLSQIMAPDDLSSSPTPLQGGEVEGEVEAGEERSLLDDDGIPF